MNTIIKTALALTMSLLATATEVHAEVLLGKVIGVSDGDTITVLDAEQVQHKVRLAGIDAPEKAQAFGQASKRALSDTVYSKTVQIEWQKLDRYKRLVGKVYVGNTDANLRQLNLGLAWHYKKYSNEQSAIDASTYANAENVAQSKRLGLWSDMHAIPPWDWRKRKKTKADTLP